ncbi:hypothetical protein [Pseudomonas sp. 273]|uniref:hypothetical protein n=1 Tax=Pseudomonas sp. 273 TaxID=75692 RepID=UPI0023D89122|nr:hypothetical protein [Pseudomonas sp. 273]
MPDLVVRGFETQSDREAGNLKVCFETVGASLLANSGAKPGSGAGPKSVTLSPALSLKGEGAVRTDGGIWIQPEPPADFDLVEHADPVPSPFRERVRERERRQPQAM